MDTKPLVKVIKKIDRKCPDSQPEIEVPPNRHQLSTVVKSWVAEFHKERGDESAAAFDSLFNNTVPEPDGS